MRRVHAAIVAALVFGAALLAQPIPSAAQTTNPWSYWANFRSVEGLALDDQYLWGATSAGVFRYHRTTKEYTYFSAFDGMAANPTAAVAIDGRGNKWFAHSGVDVGLSILDSAGVNWTHIEPRDGLLLRSGKRATTLFASGDSVWAGTESGATLFVNGIARLRLDVDDGLPSDNVKAISQVGRFVWIGTEAGLARVEGGAVRAYTTAQGLRDDNVYSLAAHPTRPHLWVGTKLGVSVVTQEGDSIVRVPSAPGDGLDFVNDGIREIAFQDTVPWVGISKGVARWRGARWEMITGGALPTLRQIGAIAFRGRDLWIGISSPTFLDPLSGIALLSPNTNPPTWSRSQLPRSPLTDYFGSLDIDHGGNIWLTSATKRDGEKAGDLTEVIRFNGTQFREFKKSDGLLTSSLADIIRVDEEDRKWIGFWDIFGGLNVLSASNTALDTINIDVVCEAVANGQEACTGIRFDARGIVWASFEFFGVIAYDPVNRRCAAWGKEEGIPASSEGEPTPNGLALDQRGRVWVGFARGSGYAMMLDPGDSAFSQSDDVVQRLDGGNTPLPNESVHCVEVDSLGRVWFGTEAGLAIYSPPSSPGAPDSSWVVHEATAGSNLLNESIRSVAFLPDGTALIGDNAGDVYTLGADLVTWGTTYNLKTVGFPNSRVSQIKYDAGRRVLWFALYGGGLVRFDPALVPPPVNPDDSARVLVYPNPWIAASGDAEIVTFEKLRGGSSVWLYTLTGESVRSLSVPAGETTLEWNLRNGGGAAVASGIYLFVVRSAGADIEHGKVAIIR